LSGFLGYSGFFLNKWFIRPGDGNFENATETRREFFPFIESYHNGHRKHSALKYEIPAKFEAVSFAQK
jgi:transposase InsO family protein